MLIDDLRMSIARQAAFDAVVRVRTSTGQSPLERLLLICLCFELIVLPVGFLCNCHCVHLLVASMHFFHIDMCPMANDCICRPCTNVLCDY